MFLLSSEVVECVIQDWDTIGAYS